MQPPFPLKSRPPEIVSPEIATSAPTVTLRIRNSGVEGSGLRATVRADDPGPLRMMAVARSGRAESSVIVPVTPGANVIVSRPGFWSAKAIAARSDPGPESLVLVTVNVVQITVAGSEAIAGPPG